VIWGRKILVDYNVYYRIIILMRRGEERREEGQEGVSSG
jgi:hypothetical protein